MAVIQADVTLVGGGIMSATLAMLLHRLDPQLQICMVEQLGDVALESSAASMPYWPSLKAVMGGCMPWHSIG